MQLNFRQNEPHYIEVEFNGEDYAFPDALREILLGKKDVEFVACRMEHPQVGFPILYLRTKTKKAIDLLEEAAAELKEQIGDFKSALKSAKKPKAK